MLYETVRVQALVTFLASQTTLCESRCEAIGRCGPRSPTHLVVKLDASPLVSEAQKHSLWHIQTFLPGPMTLLHTVVSVGSPYDGDQSSAPAQRHKQPSRIAGNAAILQRDASQIGDILGVEGNVRASRVWLYMHEIRKGSGGQGQAARAQHPACYVHVSATRQQQLASPDVSIRTKHIHPMGVPC